MAGDDFLSRWSRRKREVVEVEGPPPPAEIASRPDGEAPSVAASDVSVDEDSLTDEDIAALPSLDSLTVETDLTQFLKAGVPQVMRNAALRRMWSIDPSIRDYLCEAREYAFDWHIPGAVPGTGPMLPTDDIAGMVREIFAGSKPLFVEPLPQEGASQDERADAESPADTDVAPDVQTPVIAAADPTPSVAPERDRQGASTTRPEPVETARDAAPSGRLRRHGGASPI